MIERLNRFEAAKYCGVSVITIDRALARKEIGHFRIGRRVIFSLEHLDEFLEACERPSKRENEEKTGQLDTDSSKRLQGLITNEPHA